VSLYLYFVYFFFFFQAEDGIRDATVTGVQTCALPIYPWAWSRQGWAACSWRIYFPRRRVRRLSRGGLPLGAAKRERRWKPNCPARTWCACASAEGRGTLTGRRAAGTLRWKRSEEHTSELQSR